MILDGLQCIKASLDETARRTKLEDQVTWQGVQLVLGDATSTFFGVAYQLVLHDVSDLEMIIHFTAATEHT